MPSLRLSILEIPILKTSSIFYVYIISCISFSLTITSIISIIKLEYGDTLGLITATVCIITIVIDFLCVDLIKINIDTYVDFKMKSWVYILIGELLLLNGLVAFWVWKAISGTLALEIFLFGWVPFTFHPLIIIDMAFLSALIKPSVRGIRAITTSAIV